MKGVQSMAGGYKGEALTTRTYLRIISTSSYRLGEWRDWANCQDLDPELFFPDRGDKETAKEVRSICLECPVRLECLSYSLEVGANNGIWGGAATKVRARIKRKLIASIKELNQRD